MLLDIVCVEISFNSVLLSVNSLLCESLILRALIFLRGVFFFISVFEFQSFRQFRVFRIGHCLFELIFVKIIRT